MSTSASRTTPGQRNTIDGADRRGILQLAAHLLHAGHQLRPASCESSSSERCVPAADFEYRLASTLPRRSAAGDGLAHIVVQRLQLVRQTQRGFEVAMVHGAQLAHQRTPWALALAPGETCHAADQYFVPLRGEIKANAVLHAA